jgi:hypothetical protein
MTRNDRREIVIWPGTGHSPFCDTADATMPVSDLAYYLGPPVATETGSARKSDMPMPEMVSFGAESRHKVGKRR